MVIKLTNRIIKMKAIEQKEQLFEQVLRICQPKNTKWEILREKNSGRVEFEIRLDGVRMFFLWDGYNIDLRVNMDGHNLTNAVCYPSLGLTRYFNKAKYHARLRERKLYERVGYRLVMIEDEYDARQKQILKVRDEKILEKLGRM